jgi:DNA polymerase
MPEMRPVYSDHDAQARVYNGFLHLLRHKADLEAHNAGFEFAIWHNIMVPRYGWPEVDLRRWYCSAAKAASYGLPRSLDGATSALGLSQVKDKAGHRLMMKLCKPRPIWKRDGTGDKYFGTPEEFEQLRQYCEQDVRAEVALSEALEDLSPRERTVWLMDQEINQRGVHCDLPLVNKAITLAAEETERGKKAISSLTDGEVTAPTQVAKLRAWCNERSPSELPNLSAATVQTALTDRALPPEVRQALKLRQAHGKSSVKKYLAMLDRAGGEGRLREILLYHAAHTGRWGGKAVQPQNFPRPSLGRKAIEHILIPAIMQGDVEELEMFAGSVGEALASTLRSAITAAPGHVLLGADYSSIEARVLSWLAGDENALSLFHKGVDVYKDMAASIYGVPVDRVTKEQRQLGKVAILGLGYQMGADRFMATCADWGVKGVDLPLAKKVVKAYRAKYSKVKELWYTTQDAVLRALANQGPQKAARCAISYKPPWLHIQLPSGRLLHYYDPKAKRNQYGGLSISYLGVESLTKKWCRINAYGGKFVENIDQAIARDIMAGGMLRCRNAGYPIVMTVHDEIVAEVPEHFGTVAEFESLMTTRPLWAAGCPIAAEGWRGRRYRK